MKRRDASSRDVAVFEDSPALDLTPMLDVVFILLIFFVVTASFIRESGIGAHRPPIGETTERSDGHALAIYIDDDDRIIIDGLFVDPRAVRAYIERARAGKPRLTVVAAPAKRSTTATLVAVLDAAREAGIEAPFIADGP